MGAGAGAGFGARVRVKSSSFACSPVRGNPSRMKPPLQSGSLILSLMTEMTRLSVTRPPAAITSLACLPTSLPAATAERSISPVESCGILRAWTILGAC